ncbi:MAG: nucleotide sugar epimerase [Bdellovibrionales bacterium GWA2_49_15]|nr:MAG: nucleotide sugar epimerase [Bdellovibrionales bacterium GWA2_49_15]HAZ11703.1 nucleotide sugar epimerase [Bdellovibrionales bacterium]
MEKTKPILLTGAAGFIASHTARLLLQQGHQVVGLDNYDDYYDVRIKHLRIAELSKNPNFNFIEGNIEDEVLLKEIFSKNQFAAVINLGARAGVRNSILYPKKYFNTNTLGTLNLLNVMLEFGVKKFVLASTSSLYSGQEMPYREDIAGNCPLSPYAASKKAAEVTCYSYKHLHGFDVSILRYFTVYGPSGRPDMAIFRFIKWIDEGKPIQLFGDGLHSRDFTYVDDIANGTVLALKQVGYEVMNLGGGNKPITMNEIITMLEKLVGKKAIVSQLPAHNADMKSTWADISKAKELLGWAPKISLHDGLERTVKWYFENQKFIKDLKV